MGTPPQLYDWLTLAAILLGPLVGIWVTRAIDKQNERSKKREEIFEALIKTRGLELTFEHSGALNMVPFLFAEQEVRSAYSRTMEALNDGALGSQDQTVLTGALHRLHAARSDLIREIALAVGHTIPQNEQERFGYAPSAWTRQYAEQETLRSHLIEALEGRRALHTITNVFIPPGASTEQAEPLIETDTKVGTSVKRQRWSLRKRGESGE